MNAPYEILIRGEAGSYKGSHVIDKPGDPARPITPQDLAAIAPSINASAIAKAAEADEAIAAATQERDETLAEVDAIAAEAAKPQPDKAVIAAALTRAKMPAAARQKADLERQIAELQRQRDEMDTPGANKKPNR